MPDSRERALLRKIVAHWDGLDCVQPTEEVEPHVEKMDVLIAEARELIENEPTQAES